MLVAVTPGSEQRAAGAQRERDQANRSLLDEPPDRIGRTEELAELGGLLLVELDCVRLPERRVHDLATDEGGSEVQVAEVPCAGSGMSQGSGEGAGPERRALGQRPEHDHVDVCDVAGEHRRPTDAVPGHLLADGEPWLTAGELDPHRAGRALPVHADVPRVDAGSTELFERAPAELVRAHPTHQEGFGSESRRVIGDVGSRTAETRSVRKQVPEQLSPGAKAHLSRPRYR